MLALLPFGVRRGSVFCRREGGPALPGLRHEEAPDLLGWPEAVSSHPKSSPSVVTWISCWLRVTCIGMLLQVSAVGRIGHNW